MGRIAGADRYETGVRLSEQRFPDRPDSSTVFVTSGTALADALYAGPAVGGQALLAVAEQSVPGTVAAELERLAPSSVVVVGGTEAVSAQVEQDLRQYAGSVSRIAGSDRYETAVRLSELRYPEPPQEGTTVYVTSGTALADALYAGPVAGSSGAAALLPVARDAVPEVVARELERLGPVSIVVVGGEAVVSEQVEQQLRQYAPVSRLAGADRYGTAVELSQLQFPEPPSSGATPYAVSGTAFADALLAGPLVAEQPSAVLLPVEREQVPQVVADELRRLDPVSTTVVGGEAVVSEQVEQELSTY